MNDFCAYTCVCEEDACWVDQYLAEVERLGMLFAVHLDRCSAATERRLQGHRMCVGSTYNRKDEFDETHKQGAFDLAAKRGRWAMAWDVDETYEADAPAKLLRIAGSTADFIDVRWLNLWGDVRHVRTDGPFGRGHRVKFYATKRVWKFTGKVTNGAKMCDDYGVVLCDGVAVEARDDLACLHHGMMTRELREMHKTRWDRIYTAAVGKNPYGFWDYALDPDIEPAVEVYP